MPRTCTICRRDDRQVIDGMIANHIPYLEIAGKLGLNHRTVNAHGKKHVLPFIDSVERRAEAVVLERVMRYRDQVNLPLKEKSKYIENLLWDDYYAAKTTQDRVAVIRTITPQQGEQARLAGAYRKDAPNESDMQVVVKGLREWYTELNAERNRAKRVITHF